MNNIGDSGVEEIAELLTVNKSLTHLDLNYNGMCVVSSIQLHLFLLKNVLKLQSYDYWTHLRVIRL